MGREGEVERRGVILGVRSEKVEIIDVKLFLVGGQPFVVFFLEQCEVAAKFVQDMVRIAADFVDAFCFCENGVLVCAAELDLFGEQVCIGRIRCTNRGKILFGQRRIGDGEHEAEFDGGQDAACIILNQNAGLLFDSVGGNGRKKFVPVHSQHDAADELAVLVVDDVGNAGVKLAQIRGISRINVVKVQHKTSFLQ